MTSSLHAFRQKAPFQPQPMRYSIACILAGTGLAIAAPAASQAFGPATPIDASLGEPW